MNSDYSIDRKTASKMLKVSIRTVDRYIKAKKITFVMLDNRILLNKRELQRLRSRQYVDISGSGKAVSVSTMSIDKNSSQYLKKSRQKMSTQNQDIALNKEKKGLHLDEMSRQCVDNFSSVKVGRVDKLDKLDSFGVDTRSINKEHIKSSFFSASDKENQQDEIQTRRDLEQKLSSAKYQLLEMEQFLEKTLEEKERQNTEAYFLLKKERFKKRLIMLIFFVLLSLQPLWLILYFKF